MRYDAPRAVRIEDNSLNLAQAIQWQLYLICALPSYHDWQINHEQCCQTISPSVDSYELSSSSVNAVCSYQFLKCQFLPRSARVRRFPDATLLHISLNTAHSGCKPSSSILSFTHSLRLPAPIHTSHPATTTFLQADTQSSPLLRSTCLNHLNLPVSK